ncbi:DUF4402 domain-containing protein [Sphingomonas gilva]|uniref:DUF4402 domain-containing protein n=1 Tax=Sphingomonas gilva TaxID=2305907 RepID=A0A396RMN8_9SPHN|nr:DUF4402 domain-containing protein [Sphingomonas gilva]RHW17638.1 DUF4402 domain-containing protein [Sphingomonas gilva]
MGSRILLAAMLALAGPATARAQCQLCPAGGDSAPAAIGDALFPLRVTVETELDFSRMVIASNASGSATLDPRSGARTVSGGLSALGGIPVRGTVRVTGRPLRRLRVSMPAEVELTAPGGGAARLVDLRTDLPGAPRLGILGTVEFRFGGTLRVPAGEAGDYRGRIPIEVDYE